MATWHQKSCKKKRISWMNSEMFCSILLAYTFDWLALNLLMAANVATNDTDPPQFTHNNRRLLGIWWRNSAEARGVQDLWGLGTSPSLPHNHRCRAGRVFTPFTLNASTTTLLSLLWTLHAHYLAPFTYSWLFCWNSITNIPWLLMYFRATTSLWWTEQGIWIASLCCCAN